MSRKKRNELRKSRRDAPSRRLELHIAEAKSLIDLRKFDQAEVILEQLNRTHPSHPEVLFVQIAAAIAIKDNARLLELVERFIRVQPNDPMMHVLLGGLYFSNGWLLMAVRTFRDFVARWPRHPEAVNARNSIAELEGIIPNILETMKIEGEKRFEHACLHEQVLAHLSLGRSADAKRVGEQLVKVLPHYVPGLNNLAVSCIAEGDFANARISIQRALTLDPDNAFALSNLVRVLVFTGQQTESKATSEKLKQLKPNKSDSSVKIVESLSLLGDDEGVLRAVEHINNSSFELPPRIRAMVEHLAATALCRLDREPEARRQWRRALRNDPKLVIAQDNLNDLDLPVSERHGGWAFPVSEWLALPLIENFFRRLDGSSSEKEETAIARHFFQEHPEIVLRISALLDRGDPFGRELALRLALVVKTPETLAALKDFALSKRGPDSMRVRAGSAATETGLIPKGFVRMWAKGQWREILLMSFTIDCEPRGGLSPRGQELIRRASEFLAARNGEAAETVVREALTTDPDSPMVLNNLSVALRQQERHNEADELIREIHHRFPDYLFGILGVAELSIRNGRYDEARELLDRVMTRTNYHISEFSNFAATQITYHIARENQGGANSWLELLEQVNPDDINLKTLKVQVHRKWGWLSFLNQ